MIDIFGTLGPGCSDETTLREMFREGMTGVRLNLSHVMLRDNAGLLDTVKRAADSEGIKPKILIDLQGPELRIGNMTNALHLAVSEDIWIFPDKLLFPGKSSMTPDGASDGMDDHAPGSNSITVDYRIFDKLERNDSVLLDDGKILGVISYKNERAAKLSIKRGGILTGRKSILIEGKTVLLPTLTDTDIINIKDAVELGVTGVMQPFVRSRQDIIILRDAINSAGGKGIEIYAKIENLDGVRMLSELMDECDEIVIARGDLGNAVPLWELPAIQKQIAKACRDKGKRFMVVTQMLSSMEHRPVPTRAEVSDIYNAVQDGATSVMVTGETAIGDFPIEVIRFLSRTTHESEKTIKK